MPGSGPLHPCFLRHPAADPVLKELLSGDQSSTRSTPTPPLIQENRLIVAATDVSSIYRRRNRRSTGRWPGTSWTLWPQGRELHGVLLYQYLNAVAEVFSQMEARGELPFTWVSQSSTCEEEREDFLALFAGERDESFAALCVMGESFPRD